MVVLWSITGRSHLFHRIVGVFPSFGANCLYRLTYQARESLPEAMAMSPAAMNPSAAPAFDFNASLSGKSTDSNVVEIGLLLPTDWAVALVDLAEKRHQSVGELLRMYIGRALIENESV